MQEENLMNGTMAQAAENAIEAVKEKLVAKKTRRKQSGRRASKKTASASRQVKVARSAPKAAESKPKRLPKTKLANMRFTKEFAEITLRDNRRIRTPLKYLDKRLTKLSPAQLRAYTVGRGGRSVAWPAQNIVADVATALHFQG